MLFSLIRERHEIVTTVSNVIKTHSNIYIYIYYSSKGIIVSTITNKVKIQIILKVKVKKLKLTLSNKCKNINTLYLNITRFC